MPAPAHNLAIETSGRVGSVSLGHADQILETADLGPQRRHAVALMPAIDQLCRRHHLTPAHLAEIYVSTGPGSFTGLRVAISTAKMLGWALHARLVAVPTLHVIAHNAPPHASRIAVCLNAKAGNYYTGFFKRNHHDQIEPIGEAHLLAMSDILARLQALPPADAPAVILGDKLEPIHAPHVEPLTDDAARARSQVVWQIGRTLANAGRFTSPAQLLPHYVRLPEAERVWLQKQANTPRD